MGIHSYSYTEVECDTCGCERSDVKHKTYYIEKLRDEGWKIGKKVTCPECIKEKMKWKNV